MPNPKRRYIQYCHGAPLAQWDKYIHRIMAKTHERGRLTDEEYAEYAVETLKFDRKEATFTEKQCLEWVKAMGAQARARGAARHRRRGRRRRARVGGGEEAAAAVRAREQARRRRTAATGKAAAKSRSVRATGDACPGRGVGADRGRRGAVTRGGAGRARSFDRWVANPYPVADGFSSPAGEAGP